MKQLERSHTGEKVCESIESMIDYWKISKEQIHLILTDNISNMKKALRDANLSGFGCFAHSLQLVINDGVSSCCSKKYCKSLQAFNTSLLFT